FGGKQIGAMERCPGRYSRIVERQLLAEVDAFLDVGLAGGELAPQREIAAPSATAFGHRDLHLHGLGQRKEAPAGSVEAFDSLRVDAVALHVEEPGVAAGALDLARNLRSGARAAIEKRRHVDDRKMSSVGHRAGSLSRPPACRKSRPQSS